MHPPIRHPVAVTIPVFLTWLRVFSMTRYASPHRCWPTARRRKPAPLVDCAGRGIHMRDRAAGPSAATGGERFYDLALLHRGRTGLTQRDVAARLGVHVRSVQAWEGGISCLDAAHLRALLAAYLTAGGLDAGQELMHHSSTEVPFLLASEG